MAPKARARDAVATLPNLVSLARGLSAPVVLILLYHSGLEWLGMVVCGAAVASDAIDGHIARRFRCETRLGSLIDPLADKALMTVVWGVVAAMMGSAILWALVCVVASRDVAISAQRLRAYRRGEEVASGRLGKLKTGMQSVAGIGALVWFFGLDGAPAAAHLPLLATSSLMAALSLLSAWASWRGLEVGDSTA